MRANTNKLNFYVDDDVKKKLKKLSKESGLTMTAVITKLSNSTTQNGRTAAYIQGIKSYRRKYKSDCTYSK